MADKLSFKGSINMQYTVEEHYVPQMILNNFAQSDHKINIIHKESGLHDKKTSDKLCFDLDTYEVKNLDQTYYLRNEIEKLLSKHDDSFSIKFRRIINCKLGNKQSITKSDIKALKKFMCLQILRLNTHKSTIVGDITTQTPEKTMENQAIYLSIFMSLDEMFDYLSNNQFELSDWAKNEIKKSRDKSLYNGLYEQVKKECGIYIVKPINSEFCLSDNPVIIRGFDVFLYFFPVSPKYALACVPKQYCSNIDICEIVEMAEKDVETINLLSISQTNEYIIFSENYLSQTTSLIKKVIESGDDSWHISTNTP